MAGSCCGTGCSTQYRAESSCQTGVIEVAVPSSALLDRAGVDRSLAVVHIWIVDQNVGWLSLVPYRLGRGAVGRGHSRGSISTEENHGAPEARRRQCGRADALGVGCNRHTDIVLVGGG